MFENYVIVSQGTLKGKTITTDNGFVYNSYQGIPYARPPIGDLRFRDPEPAEGWAGVLDATKERAVCAQVDWIFVKSPVNVYMGEEDSLYLNIYVPKTDAIDSKIPVMFWIHGGGFMMGSGNTDYYGPDYLIEKNVILVTFNYRVGPLGFLSLNTNKAPGNVGLKDQVLALKWVKLNISQFGGDPDNITIFGESAGSASVQYLILSKTAQGLFHKAVCQSGSCANVWALQTNPEDNAFLLAERLGMISSDKDEVISFLKTVSTEKLVKAASESSIDNNTEIPFLPTIEITGTCSEPFLLKHPLELLKNGEFNKVPTMSGFTPNEGIIWYYKLTKAANNIPQKQIITDFTNFLTMNDKNILGSKKSAEAGEKIKDFYFPTINKSSSTNLIENYVKLMSDYGFIKEIDYSAKMFSKYSPPAYYYKFSFHGSLNLMKYLCDHDFTEAGHVDELGYLFKNNTLIPNDVQLTSADIGMIKTMTELWTNFAKFCNPTPEKSENIPIVWKPINGNEVNCLEINTKLCMITDPFAERRKFWEGLIKQI